MQHDDHLQHNAKLRKIMNTAHNLTKTAQNSDMMTSCLRRNSLTYVDHIFSPANKQHPRREKWIYVDIKESNQMYTLQAIAYIQSQKFH